MQQSVLENFENTREKELAPRSLDPVPGTKLAEKKIYLSSLTDLEVGGKVTFDIGRCGRNNKQVSCRPVGTVAEFLKDGQVLIKGIGERSVYNRSLDDVEAVRG